MRGIIYCCSTTGNTRLVCQAIKSRVKKAKWELYNIADESIPDCKNYDIVGIATYTDFWGPPQKVQWFIENMIKQNNNKISFILNTHAGESGKTLMILNDWMKSKGFKVIAGLSLITPVNYPPVLAEGWSNNDDPTEAAIEGFDGFILHLDQVLEKMINGDEVEELNINLTKEEMSHPYAVRTAAKDDMGEIFVNEEMCTNCGVCKNHCLYQAIELNQVPIFDMSKCYGCWACYNLCPSQAIFTNKLQSGVQYHQPTEKFKVKLRID